MTAARTTTCPSCRAAAEADPGFSPWCDRCGWNVAPERREAPVGTVERIYKSLGRRFGASLFDEVRRKAPSKPPLGVSTIVAFLLAALIYAATLGIAVVGVILVSGVLRPGTNLFAVIAGVFLLAVAWVFRPRLPSPGESARDRQLQRRADLPEVYRLVDKVTAAAGGAGVDAILIAPDFNAAYGRMGLLRRRVLLLGLPLFLSLEPQERVALLGHELGHAVNGDPGRGTFMSGALDALVGLYELLEPDELFPADEGLAALPALPLRLVQLLLARAALSLARAHLLLLYRDSQRAEYYADALASRLAGREATARMLERLHAGDAVDRMTWLGGSADPVGDVIRKVRSLPPREIERIRRAEREHGLRLDYTHPPTSYRVEVIRSRPTAPAALVLTSGESDAIDRELQRFREPIGAEIVDRYLGAIT